LRPVIAEGNETPGGESGGGAEGRGRRSEGDLLAERRARRAAESGEHALTLRAEAAEATVRTLETHVASLQQRLDDAEQESRRIADLLDAERAPRHGERSQPGRHAPTPHEPALARELERVSQREYAEQRLRVEAEDRSFELQRESRAEIERLNRRLSASERDTQALGARLEVVQRELAEAEQTVATERAAMQQTEHALRARLSELEGATLDLHGALEAERAARRRAERLLDALRGAQRNALALLGGLADTIARLREASPATAASSQPPSQQHGSPPPAAGPGAGPIESAASDVDKPTPAPTAEPPVMRQAAAEGERPPAPPAQPADEAATPVQPATETRAARSVQAGGEIPDSARSAEMAQALAAAVERLRARVEEQGAPPVARVAPHPPHKHSMSLITRSRLALRRRRERRKQRRER
jgi:hypothetical protein